MTADAAARLITEASAAPSGLELDWKSSCVMKVSRICILESRVSTDEFDSIIT